VLLIDWQHEGYSRSFDIRLVEQLSFKDVSIIAFGGISSADQMRELFTYPNVAAVSVGNFLSYRENAIQQFKDELASTALRPSSYATEYTIQANA